MGSEAGGLGTEIQTVRVGQWEERETWAERERERERERELEHENFILQGLCFRFSQKPV